MVKVNHDDISGRLGGVEPLGEIGPKKRGLGDMLAGFVAAPVLAADRAMSNKAPSMNSVASIVSPHGMG